MLDQNPSHLAWCQAALQAKQRHPQFDQMIKPITDPMAPPAAELRLPKGHPELPQISQLVDQQGGRRRAARQRPRHLTMRQTELCWDNHNICSFTSVLLTLQVRIATIGKIGAAWERAAGASRG